jgi:hypothetical protein
MPSGKVSVQQYATKTGLLLQEDNSYTRQGQDITETKNYNDYRKVGNVMFPFEIVRSVGEQVITIKMTEINTNKNVTSADFQ